MLAAMLAAYKRTLQYTLAQSASMDDVVQRRALPWVNTPDAAMAWGVALGLNAEIEMLLNRTVQSSVASGRQVGWYPMWFYGPATPADSAVAGAVGLGAVALGRRHVLSERDPGRRVHDVVDRLDRIVRRGGGGGFGGGGRRRRRRRRRRFLEPDRPCSTGSVEASSEAFRDRGSHRAGMVVAPGNARHGDNASSRPPYPMR